MKISQDLVRMTLPPDQLVPLATVAALLDLTQRRVRQLVAQEAWPVVVHSPYKRFVQAADLYAWVHGPLWEATYEAKQS